jgi:hypothetical protein
MQHTAIETQDAKFHRYRISLIEAWPEGEYKRAALAATRAALERELSFERERCSAPRWHRFRFSGTAAEGF